MLTCCVCSAQVRRPCVCAVAFLLRPDYQRQTLLAAAGARAASMIDELRVLRCLRGARACMHDRKSVDSACESFRLSLPRGYGAANEHTLPLETPSQSSQRSDDAWFVNALVPGAVLEGAYSPMTLTQGPMECAPIMCASCSAEVRRPLDPDNACLFIFNAPA